nr:M56 family metallopeptidase [Acididesulfobacillus acetoxydans]
MGSLLALGILFIQRLFRQKLSTHWHYALWFVLILRLLIPWTPPSSFSAFNPWLPLQQTLHFRPYPPHPHPTQISHPHYRPPTRPNLCREVVLAQPTPPGTSPAQPRPVKHSGKTSAQPLLSGWLEFWVALHFLTRTEPSKKTRPLGQCRGYVGTSHLLV